MTEGEYDAFIVGSDQVWRPSYNQHLEQAFLNFTKNWKTLRELHMQHPLVLITGNLLRNKRKNVKDSFKIRFVSVREDTAVNLCKEHLGIEATHVLDPTLLLSADDYQN